MPVTHVKGKVIPVRDHILVEDMNFGERKTKTGIIIPGDDGNLSGIRPRWARVYAVGHEQTDVQPGQYILITHGRWTRGVDVTDEGKTITIRRVDNKDVLLVSDDHPGIDETVPNNGL
jgi:co-chaperonin GroES (HSP10)